jgi:hypothetical protein
VVPKVRPSTVAIAAPTVIGASAITVVDTGTDGATMGALAGDSIYDAFVVASSQQTLFNDPYSLVAPAFSLGIDGASWGPQAATTSIAIGDLFGINQDFSLTGNDQATVNSNFFIVPEPSTVALLALGGVLALRRRNG